MSIGSELREGFSWPGEREHLYGRPSLAGRLARAVRWASYEARERLAEAIHVDSPKLRGETATPPARAFLGEPPCGDPACPCAAGLH